MRSCITRIVASVIFTASLQLFQCLLLCVGLLAQLEKQMGCGQRFTSWGSLNTLVILIGPSTVKLVVNQREGIVDWSDV
jgi:hypothetical protein